MDAEKINKDNLNEVTGGNGPMTPEEERTMRIWNRAVYFRNVLGLSLDEVLEKFSNDPEAQEYIRNNWKWM